MLIAVSPITLLICAPLLVKQSKSTWLGRIQHLCPVLLKFSVYSITKNEDEPAGWCPPDVSWFINPIDYSYVCHKPQNSATEIVDTLLFLEAILHIPIQGSPKEKSLFLVGDLVKSGWFLQLLPSGKQT